MLQNLSDKEQNAAIVFVVDGKEAGEKARLRARLQPAAAERTR
jgi:hypothetical protein